MIPDPKPTVLVVDDDRVIADTLAAILRSEGFGAKAVYSGNAAVADARQYVPDALVCDSVLGEANGIEIAIQIGVVCPNCRIILISGAQVSGDLLDQARAAGHEFDVLAKPFHPTTLIEKLRSEPGQTDEAA